MQGGQGGALDCVIETFSTIHDGMWDINNMCSGDDCVRLKDRKTRQQIIDIIWECAELDARAAELIEVAIG